LGLDEPPDRPLAIAETGVNAVVATTNRAVILEMRHCTIGSFSEFMGCD
jgi:hypothetical protein